MKLKHDDVLGYIEKLPYSAFKDVAVHYADHHKIDIDDALDNVIMTDFQKRLDKLGINKTCPACGSTNILKNGKRKHIQRYKCKDCQNQFTPFSNTILETTKFHWETWVTVMELVLNNYSLSGIRHKLERDLGYGGIDRKTIFLWRHKLIHALASMPQPRLSGVVQVDETFIRESQKGTRTLKSYITGETREPRYSRMPSKFGVMGPEFATVVTAVDDTGHCVCKVTGLGRLTSGVFLDNFEWHLPEPAYLCSDANPLYRQYCDIFSISHYERPSNYLKTLQEHGYVTPSRIDTILSDIQHKDNEVIKFNLYQQGLIDRITNKGAIGYQEFKDIKTSSNLNLGRVNSLHNEIKRFVNRNMTNVSTKYLADYIGYFAYLKNYKQDHDIRSFSRKDAEAILVEILKIQARYTVSDLKRTELILQKPTPRYTALLKEHTERARKVTNNKYFKFDEEDKVISFDKRNYLMDLPESKIQAICKKYGIRYKRKWVRWSTVSLILKHPDIQSIFIELINKDKAIKLAPEDLEYLSKEQYRKTS